jgi:TolB-like protein/Flp pilus assembly protein TadD
MAEERLPRRLAAILSADMVGYSHQMGRDEAGTLARLKSLRRDIVDPTVAAHAGRTVKLMGDGTLVEFASAVDAVACAVELQKRFAERNAGTPDGEQIDFRIGINVGDVIVDADDIYGDGVNVAARIQALAEPGSVYISRAVADQVRGKLPVGIEALGERRVKNIAQPIEVFRIGATTDDKDAKLPTTDKPSIAVLAFSNMSGDPEQEYFSDGIAEDIITSLSKLPELHVIARNSCFTYKGKPVDVKRVGRELGVRNVLEGSVRKSGNRVRVSGQLIDAESGAHLWAERYDRELVDIFAVQDDITAQIVSALRVKLMGADRPRSRVETENPEAYDCVLRGREQYRLYSREGNDAARRFYERAILLDPNYAAAHAGLAETWLHARLNGAPEGLDRAFIAAQTARNLDPSSPLVYEALSMILLFRRQFDDAANAASRWIEIEPNDPEAYATLAGIRIFAGEPEQVEELIGKAKHLNPFYPAYYDLYLGQAAYSKGRFGEAAQFVARSIARNPLALPALTALAACYGQLGDSTRARDALADIRRINPKASIAWVRTIAVYRRAADVERLLEGLRKAGLPE